MHRALLALGLTGLLWGCAPPEAEEGTAGERTEAAATPAPAAPAPAAPAPALVPADFDVPVRVEAQGFVVRPLGPELVDIDYEAYMSSIEHLRETFTRSDAWPTPWIDAEDAMADMENEERRFLSRESFAYAVLTPDGTRERGCVYVRPSPKAGYDAMVRLWVTKAEFDAGFDAELQAWAEQWVAERWPFERVAFPGRQIPWSEWEALPDA
jgi:hypothetical protein